MGVKDKIVERMLGSSGKFSDKQVAQTLDVLLEHGLERGATSVHIEPHERYDIVRYRIGNTLHGMHKLPRTAHSALMRQLKKRASLDELDSSASQSGEFDTSIGNQKVAVDISIIPVFGGEKAVLHLRPDQQGARHLEELGFWGSDLSNMRQALTQPHGLITVSGPRRSGVSTTLHSLLDSLSSPLVSISTVEVRPHRRLPGASQLQPTKHDNTTRQLKNLLGHDSNIIMVDRLTDGEAMRQTVDAAQRGHLMLGSLYADDAPSSLAQARAFGVEPYLLAHTLRASVGQQLARKLCANCREKIKLDPEEQQKLHRRLGLSNVKNLSRVHQLEQDALESGIGDSSMSSQPTGITYVWRANPSGCADCHRTGYNGQTALTEVVIPDDQLRSILNRHQPPTAQEIRNHALNQQFKPLALDGVIKSLRGQTSLEEVMRVCTI